MVAVFILKNGAWVQHGPAMLDNEYCRRMLAGEVAHLQQFLGVTAGVFVKTGN